MKACELDKKMITHVSLDSCTLGSTALKLFTQGLNF